MDEQYQSAAAVTAAVNIVQTLARRFWPQVLSNWLRRLRTMDSIVLDSVSKKFRCHPALFNWIGSERNGETLALEQLSLSVAAGSILALLGPNGSGKTTTLKLISTTLLPDAGRIVVEGADTRDEANQVRKHIGFAIASERSFFPRLSARENLDFFAALDDVPRKIRPQRIDDTLERVGLTDASDTLVMKFSSGMCQRLGIARALIKQPSIILLDEPTRSLDPAAATQIWSLIRELPAYGTTVLIATHSFDEASAVGDQIAVLHGGKLKGCRRIGVSGPAELRSFYFQAIGQLDEAAELARESCR
jgi:ABC-type multidrug transport system ATPase subunit